MTVWKSGRESAMLDAIADGEKTIEGRLNNGKFAQYSPGDQVSLRRDYRDEKGVLHDGEFDALCVEVVAVRRYATFFEMVAAEGHEQVIPGSVSPQAAAQEYLRYYLSEDEARYGVLAIEVRSL